MSKEQRVGVAAFLVVLVLAAIALWRWPLQSVVEEAAPPTPTLAVTVLPTSTRPTSTPAPTQTPVPTENVLTRPTPIPPVLLLDTPTPTETVPPTPTPERTMVQKG